MFGHDHWRECSCPDCGHRRRFEAEETRRMWAALDEAKMKRWREDAARSNSNPT